MGLVVDASDCEGEMGGIGDRVDLVSAVGRIACLSEINVNLVTRMQSVWKGGGIGNIDVIGYDEAATGQLVYDSQPGELLGIGSHDSEPIIVGSPHNLIDAIGSAATGAGQIDRITNRETMIGIVHHDDVGGDHGSVEHVGDGSIRDLAISIGQNAGWNDTEAGGTQDSQCGC